jgi:PIN domain nuclease of toxin-antitoxin system
MRLLLDTQIVYWFFFEEENVPSAAWDVLNRYDEVYVSAVSIWEIAIKVRLGKMKADPHQVATTLKDAGFIELPVYARHTVLVANMPLHHGDPFDRLLMAQAMEEPMRFLTTDSQMKQYSELVIEV